MGEDGIREKDGVQGRIKSAVCQPEIQCARRWRRILPNQLKELGISCTLEGVGWDTAYDRAQSDP